MHFERSLKKSIYPAWADQYIDYQKLKALLHDDGSDAGSVAGDDDWTEKDEEAFVEELINVQLEKVHHFQSSTIQTLRDRVAECETKLDGVAAKDKGKEDEAPKKADQDAEKTLKETKSKLDSFTKEMNELEKFSRINYTGFLKAAKKHDRRRGNSYRVMPIMRVRLSELPFNKEDYSPLLFRISTMYSFIRQHLESADKPRTFSEYSISVDHFTSHKYWVHPDNLLELKTVIARRLPLLVYNPQDSKVAEGGQRDPTITSIYFDNPQFSLYNAKVGHTWPATSLRVRWYDSLSTNPEIFIEKKTVFEDDTSEEHRFVSKPKYLKGFLNGDNKMEKEVQRLIDRVGEDSEQVPRLKETIDDIQTFVRENNLQPMTRANYTRAAFQIPGDNRVRITLDTNLALVREDSLDADRPCRDPEDWHRRDIDDNGMEYPFSSIRKGEISRFPYALLEIRTKGDRQSEWVSDLVNSHLVKKAPRFSKFIHGTAQLFDDYVNTFPFWLSEVDTDIRKDPHQAFEEEQERKAKAAEDEVAVGSLLGPLSKSINSNSGFKPSKASPVGSPRVKPASSLNRRATARSTRVQFDGAEDKKEDADDIDDDDADSSDAHAEIAARTRGIRSFIPSLSSSKYAQAKRQRGQDLGSVVLPEGVKEPAYWIKDEGEVKVEAKVWLANQRTFIKWQHVAILLASLSLGLFNAAGKNNYVARTLGVVYTVMAIFIAVWGWGVYMYRANLIQKRSGKDFDNILGPCLVCVGLIAALCLNFGFKYQAILQEKHDAEKQSIMMMGNTSLLG